MDQFPSAYFKLADNLDLQGIAFEPLQGGAQGFTGAFDGAGFTLKNLTVQAGTAALFENLGVGGVVKNVVLENPQMQGQSMAGSVVGSSQGLIENVHVLSLIHI